LRTNVIKRCCLTGWIAAGAVGAVLLLGGCASDGASERGGRPFANGAGGNEPAHRQAKADSFPTAQEAGLL
jgi:hypothetical protein